MSSLIALPLSLSFFLSNIRPNPNPSPHAFQGFWKGAPQTIMETSPLSLAHTHARNAVLETRKSNPVAASEEHDLAAGEFASAILKSSDHEAVRTLKLLEAHHKQMAEILRFQPEQQADATALPSLDTPSANLTSQTSVAEIAHSPKTSSQDAQVQLSRPPRLISRESSSIASNLASARGIPSHPQRGSPVSPSLSSHQAGAKMTEVSSRTSETRIKNRQSRANATRPPWSPPLPSTSEISSHEVVPRGSPNTRSRPAKILPLAIPSNDFTPPLKAPLAFTGLPMTSDGSTKTETGNRKSLATAKLDRHQAHSDRKSSIQDSPDVSRHFSRAALRSIQENNGTSPNNTAESFYVVPTTGGTMSYAGILSRAEKEARRNSADDGNENFVDAREMQSSPEMLQNSAKKPRSRRNNHGIEEVYFPMRTPKTMEELAVENEALKELSDTLSKRLHMWEVNAQSSSMALQQSLRAMHNQNTGSPDLRTPGLSAGVSTALSSTTESDPKVKELQDILLKSEQKLERAARENDRLKNTLGRYRERWEKLKEGAKTRRESLVAEGEGSKKPDTTISPHPDIESPNKSEAETETERAAAVGS
ncbi:hypothetical protein N7532_006853 [Penicillium argentinense]|uniref:Spindle pole body-associated protein cut12 domain-containing protein n=1 Tax=Penicillium argentinense TaxID=1131581 RepID=A0A9W9FGP0_9EURO|nr:uncharacterized protein N7532_006853 [Penicillium argentinense]KAJ5099852.1 hypothetical protein N7532_006853 [Penicillium argentinense]